MHVLPFMYLFCLFRVNNDILSLNTELYRYNYNAIICRTNPLELKVRLGEQNLYANQNTEQAIQVVSINTVGKTLRQL